MIEIIKTRGMETISRTMIEFYDENGNICMGFDADNNGNPVFDNPYAEKNYNRSMEKVKDGLWSMYKDTCTRTFSTNAIGKCKCGTEIELYDEYMGACECPECGRWYNIFGQELNNPCTWSMGADW